MKQALILENIDRGSTDSFLRASEFTIKRKILNSSTKNWVSIIKILESDNDKETIVVAKFTEAILELLIDDDYKKVSKRLLKKIAERKHIIFIYSDNYHGYFNFRDGYAEPDEVKNQKLEYSKPLKKLIKKLNSKNLNIVTYETLTDLEISSQSFIENVAQGLLLKFYIPNDNFGSIELDKFIILFKNFISSVSDIPIRIHQNRTSQGVTCTLYSESKEVTHDEIYSMFDDFTKFMELCVNDPEKAAEILEFRNIPKEKIATLISRHVKEAKRILLDLKQDKERRILQARQNLESELLEEHISTPNLDETIKLIAPQASNIKDIISDTKVETLNLNINPQIINKVEGAVAKEFYGSINITREDEQLKAIIEKFSESSAQKAELNSAVHEMNDDETSVKDKKFAASKLKNFVVKYGEKIGDFGFRLLTKYLETKLGI